MKTLAYLAPLLALALLAACQPAATTPPQEPAATPPASAASAAPPASAPPASAAPPSAALVGRWTSARFEGEGCPPEVKQLDIELLEGGAFSMKAQLTQGSDQRQGTWQAQDSRLTLQLPGAPPLLGTFAVTPDGLVIEEDNARCKEHYRRAP